MPLPPASARSRPRLLVSLAEAREQALTKRKLARSGGNPLAEKRRAEGMHTFADASRRVLDQKRGGWRGRWHAQNWLPASNATRSRALDPSTVGRPSDIDDTVRRDGSVVTPREAATGPASWEEHELDKQAEDGWHVPEFQQLHVGLQVGDCRLQVIVDPTDLGLHAVDVMFEVELGHQVFTASDGGFFGGS